ncbi:isoaspartyl peptidase/L-asparaginase-like isoform X2 [Lytechinus variegatus]|uniref:isoaspartyl peptidase/L-asparaginase-like isoform X2 n=1 Tax=Lytechinus variegatus TaxID=7654 RepID=UPI001BB19C50|nr:isoaspartyl peptidase/L-asparaginase-like isoform X2 [Lytechinus variegatus]
MNNICYSSCLTLSTHPRIVCQAMHTNNMERNCFVPAIAVHGGAWAIPQADTEASCQGVQRAVRAGYKVLEDGGTAVDAVEQAVRVLEDDPVFDADHTLLVGHGANKFANEMGIEKVPTSDLVTEDARKTWEEYRKFKKTVDVFFSSRTDAGHDTVGCVAVDRLGNVACATSTGGISAKKVGRVGDSPIIGSGAYCDNAYGAVSTTGHGENIMKVTLARTIISYMEHLGLSAKEAADKAIAFMSKRVGGVGGAIVVSSSGQLAKSFNSERMAWAFASNNSVRYGIDPGDDIDGGAV